MRLSPKKTLIAALLMVFGGWSLPIFTFAQEDEEDDIYEISPFVVLDEEDSGYIATQTLAGTRLRSNLSDIGASVQVLTSEFLDDIAATESTDLLLFTTSTEIAGLGGNFSGGAARQDDRVLTGAVLNNPQGASRIRGLGAPDNTRDFFLTSIPWDSYNSGRVEINRGANAILFGLGSPSGVQNVGLNRAVFDEINRVEFRVQDGGEELSYRAWVDFNRVLVEDKLAVRVAGARNNRNYSQKPAYQDQERYYVTATWRPFENTVVRVSYENGHIRANNPDPVGPLQAIDHYIREIGRYHRALAEDGAYIGAPETNLPLTYDPWRFSMRWPIAEYRAVWQQINPTTGFTNPFQNQGFGQSLGMVWDRDTAHPSFGFPGVIPNNNAFRVDYDRSTPGFQHKVWYDYERPAADRPPNPRNPRGGRNFRRIDNAGAYDIGDYAGIFEGFNDLDLFDFSEYLLAGTAPFQNRDFDALQASLEQNFFQNKLGFELAFTKETFNRQNFNGFPGRTMGVLIDINHTLPIGTFDHNNDPLVPVQPQANPNFGRPFMIGKSNMAELQTERESVRWTGYWDFDTADWLGDNLLSDILGRSILTTLASRQEWNNSTISYSQREFGPREANLNETFGTRPDPRHFDYLVYLGPPVDLVSDPAGITRDMFQINPVNNQKVWNPGGPPVPTTYYDVTKQEMVTHNLERRLAAINGEHNGTVNDSLAAILQSFLINENIVTTLGWRQDEVTNTLANTPILTDTATPEQVSSLGIVNNTYDYLGTIAQNGDGEYLFEEPEITFVKEDIFSWGAVAKLPREWNPFPWMDSASLFYSESQNFQPAPGRENHLGVQLPSPTGTTEDIGFNFAFLNNKINLRINRFEAAINNASYPGVNRVYAQSETTTMRGWINNALTELAIADFSEIIENENSPNFGELLRMPATELEALLDEFLDFFGMDIDRQNNVVTLDQNNPFSAIWTENNWRTTTDPRTGIVDGIEQNAAGQTDTLDQVTKGSEIELVANPVRGMRILFNVAKVETANSNIAPTMRNWIENHIGPFYAGTPTNPSKFGQLMRGGVGRRPELRANNFPNAATNNEWWYREVIRDWEVIKAQEGTFSPEVRKWRANAVVNYDFRQGALRGWGIGTNVRYQSRVAIGFPISPDEEGIPKPDIENPFYGPAQTNWGFRLAYSKRIWDNKVNWRIQLNLSNVFSDNRDLIPVRMTDTGLLAQSRTSPPRGWVLSNRFTF